jgi:hypothetical protein
VKLHGRAPGENPEVLVQARDGASRKLKNISPILVITFFSRSSFEPGTNAGVITFFKMLPSHQLLSCHGSNILDECR